MESIIQQSFKINLKIMRILFLYPPQNASCVFKVLAYTVYIVLVVPMPLLGVAYLILNENQDIERVADSAFSVAYFVIYMFKLFPFITNGDEIRKCIHYLESPIFMVNKNKQKEIIKKDMKMCRTNSKTLIIIVGSAAITWSIKPLIMGSYRLPIDIWLPFDHKVSPLCHYFVYVYIVAGGYYIALATGAVAPLIGGLALLAASQLKILKNNLTHLVEYVGEEYRDLYNRNPEEDVLFCLMHAKIKQCIKHHQSVLDFIRNYENCFSLAVFGHFFGSVFVLCFCCLILIWQEPFSLIFFFMISYILTVLAQLFFYCYYGTILFEENNTLRDAIYMSKWYDYDLKSMKALMILIERSKRPLAVTAAKIMELSLDTFMIILKRSYSLIAVLKSYH